MLEIVAVNVLIIGAGGREYSIGMALKKDEKVDALYFAPGNGATDELGTNLDISDFNELADFCEANDVELTIVGPEKLLWLRESLTYLKSVV